MTMTPTDSQPSLDHGRRNSMKWLIAGLIAVPAIAAGWWVFGQSGSSALADAADPNKQKWDEKDFARFAALLPLEQLQLLRISLGVAEPGEAIPATVDRAAWIKEITDQAVWVSSSILTYSFKDFRYDEMARWVAEEYEVAAARTAGESTFKVEQAIQTQLFVGIWDKLTPEQRLKTLEQMDPDGKLTDPAAIALMTGTAAAGAIAGAALLSGFAFYTTMSSFICAAGGLLGLTFPFAVYTGASTAVAFLATNPIGWAILAAGAVASLAWLGGANEQKSAAFVCQVNALRAAAWMGAGRKLP
jgi:hypothetical protein